MLITQELSIETELPIFQVEGFAVEVRPNEHIKCKMYGILNTNDIKGLVYLNEEGTDISIKYKGVSIFRGVVGDIKINSVANIHNFELTAYSYSKKLDREKETKLFQDINKSYEELIKYSARKYAGNIIANIRDRKIEKPILCYKETAWEFIKRMTADLRTFIYPDTVTKSPNIWLGLREGENINKEDIILESIKLEKHNDNDRIIYAFKSYISYKIGDELKDSGKNLTVYEKKVEFSWLSFGAGGIGISSIAKESIKVLAGYIGLALSVIALILAYTPKPVIERLRDEVARNPDTFIKVVLFDVIINQEADRDNYNIQKFKVKKYPEYENKKINIYGEKYLLGGFELLKNIGNSYNAKIKK